MVLKFREIPVGTVAFDENDTKTLKIPRVNAIRTMYLRFFVKVVSTATEPVEDEDTILKIIDKVRLVFDGDDNKFNVDARKLFYVEQFEKGTEPPTNKDDDQTTSETKTWYVNLQIDFASNRLDETDISALLPARRYSKLDLEIDYGAITDMFTTSTGCTITDADSGCEVEIREAIDTEDKVSFAKGQAGNGFIDFRESVFAKDIDQEYTDFADDVLEIDIKPAPNIITKHLLTIVDTNDDLSDTDVTDIKVEDTRGAGETILKRDFTMFKRSLKTEYQLESLPTGCLFIDWLDKLGGGLENTDTEGALKFKFKTASPTGTPQVKGWVRYIAGRTKIQNPANV